MHTSTIILQIDNGIYEVNDYKLFNVQEDTRQYALLKTHPKTDHHYFGRDL